MDCRWSARKCLHTTLELPDHTEPVAADIRDISLSGAYIETVAVLPYSLPLNIELHLPGSRVYECFRLQAHVVHRDKNGANLKFHGTSIDTIRALSTALSQHGLTATNF